MPRQFFTIVLVSLSISIASGQSLLVIDDRSGLLDETTEGLLSERLAGDKIEYTNMVDFKERCNYYFVVLEESMGDALASVRDCEDGLIGSKNLGNGILDAGSEEKSLLLFMALKDMISSPGRYVISGDAPVQGDPARQQEQAVQQGTVPRDSVLTNEHDSRYFFAPSAFNLKKGELYYNTVYFLLHDIQYGLDDYLSMGFGTTVIGLPIYITPKVSIPLGEKTSMAIGDMMLVGTYGTNAFGNLAYGVFSYGGPNGNVSVGGGHLYINDNEITGKTSSAVINFSAQGRLSPYIFLLTENYIMSANFNRSADTYIEDSDPYNPPYGGEYIEVDFTQRNTFWYGIAGIRIISKNKDFISWQIGLTYVLNSAGEYPRRYDSPGWWNNAREEGLNAIAFPTVSFTLKFGKRY